ncbi:MAG: YdcF family protein [Cytophagales bacterium]|nr:MAG: YdcF family protein [Cytophagales bacterium]
MFFILSKILRSLLYPTTWIFILLFFQLILSNPKIKKKITIITFIMFFLVSNGFIITKIISWYETPLTPINQVQTHEIGIILGGASRIVESDTNRLFLGPSGDRIVQAIQLYKLGKIKKILFSGGAGNLTGEKIPESVMVRKYFLQIGIPEKDLIFEDKSRNTYENAVFTKNILSNNFTPNLPYLLITSSLHMPRSVAIFKKQGFLITPFSIDQLYDPAYREIDFYFAPKTESIQMLENLLHEIIGYITYFLMGYC